MSRISQNHSAPKSRSIVYFIAARPSALKNCTFETITKDGAQTLEVECVPGYNGGLPQNFHVEITRDNHTIANLSSSNDPRFRIKLSRFVQEWHSHLQFVIYASNSRGRSESIYFEPTLPKDLQIKMGTSIL